MITVEQVSEELAKSPDYQEIQNLDINYAIFRKTIRELLQVEDQQLVDVEDVDLSIIQAIEDHAQHQLTILNLEIQVQMESDDGSEMEPSDSSILNLAQAIALLIDENYEDSHEGISDFARVTGMTPEEVVGCISAQIVPSPEQIQSIAAHYYGDDQEAYNQLLMLGQIAHEETGTSDYSQESAPIVSNSDYALRAEFNALKDQQEIGMLMRFLEKKADHLHANNLLTPAELKSLVRSDIFRNDPDSIAVFCQFCDENDVSPREYLSHVEFCLNWKEQSGPSNYGAFFNQLVSEPVDVSAVEVEEAQGFAQDYRSRNGYH